MIKLEETEVIGWEAAIRGMRNPKNSWEKKDSYYCFGPAVPDDAPFNACKDECPYYKKDDCENKYWAPWVVGPNDHKLMMSLAAGGPVHAKYRRMITVYVDITAPLYWWKEFDTYKVGTVANSCSTMHKIHAKEFTLDDFSHEHLFKADDVDGMYYSTTAEEEFTSTDVLRVIVEALNNYRVSYLDSKDKKYWQQMIQLLPTSYNQKRTVMLNYEVLNNIYISRKDHKLDEWHTFCDWIKSLPYSEIITRKED